MSRYRPLSAISRVVIHCSATPNGKPFTAADIDALARRKGFKRDDCRASRRWAVGRSRATRRRPVLHRLPLRHPPQRRVVEPPIDRSRRPRAARECRPGGVCLIGTDGFTPAQWASLRKHVVSTHESRRRRRLPVDVIGHPRSTTAAPAKWQGSAPTRRAFALMAVAEALLDEAEARELAGTFADLSIYRQRDEMEARRLRALALDMSTKTDGLKD